MIYCIRELTVHILYTLELTVQILYYKLLRNLLLTRKNQDFANCPLYLGILRAMKRKLKKKFRVDYNAYAKLCRVEMPILPSYVG